MAADWEQQGQPRSARRLVVPVVLVLVGVGAGLLAGPAAPDRTFSVVTGEDTTASEAPVFVEDTVPGGTWRAGDGGPLSSRDDAMVTWTGDRVLIWGGRTLASPDHLRDGAAYDPARDRWTRIPRAPIAGRIGAASVWTGRELVLWGGAANGRELGDGAAYDPSTGRWRRLPPSPLSPRRETNAVMAAGRIVFWGGRDGVAAPHVSDGATYDPRTRRWRRLPAGPLRARADTDVRTFAVGDDVITWSSSRAGTRVAAYDAARGRWRRLLPPPLKPGSVPALLSIDGSLLAWGEPREPSEGPQTLSFTTQPDWWSTAARPPFAPEPQRPLLGRNGIAASWSPLGGGVYFDEVANHWADMSPHPDPVAVGWPAQVWAGDRLFVWHGLAAPGADRRVLTWQPPDPWRAVTGSPVSSSGHASAIWTGWLREQQQVLVWGGTPARPSNAGAGYDPALRLWETMPLAPLSPRYGAATVWTGEQMVVVGGRDPAGNPLGDAAAYDPMTRSWAKVAPPPVATISDATAADAGVYVAGLDARGKLRIGALLSKGDWRQLPPPPLPPLRRPRVIWTGLEVWVVETAPGRPVVGAGWDPARREWRSFPTVRGVRGPVEVIWGGRRLFVVDRAGATASLGLSAQLWRRHPRSPLRGAPLSLAWTGRRLVGYLPHQQRMASLDERSAAWAETPAPPFDARGPARLVWTGRNLVTFTDAGVAMLGNPFDEQ